MGTEQLTNCTNCGAKLEIANGGHAKCDYCGSEFPAPSATERVIIDPAVQPRQRPIANYNQPANQGVSAWAVLFLILLVVIIVVFAVVNGGNKGINSSYADSVAIDTAAKKDSAYVAAQKTAATDTSNNFALRQLDAIKVDAPTFKKVYRNARKKYDQFSKTTDIYDPSSSLYVNVAGVFLYINKDTYGPELRFATRYLADDWLFIKEMTVNADGENFTMSPEFKRDNGDGSIWEWSDARMGEDDLAMLVKMATAKKVKLRYDGDKYYHVVSITQTQQAAMKKMLQIYKGMILKYDEAGAAKNNKGS
ncbi:hypothetical protein HQ865_10780 [Mucilaginibacter mali]|uniref:Uncharacterized protein n=1 Tax=Mucilaginibacter mali TaxID=2740462 RepID=A0A7D4Q3E8_9SPHI|nr:hypothetical protein [Mucilaginibacter mali]QKJ30227.1 hypothetical protein HQ865_10780 [Mucilaginibacter mali]